MNFELIYDVALTSEAPRYALGLCGVSGAVTVVWSVWLKARGQSLHAGAIFFAVLAVIMLALGIGLRMEQRYLAERKDFHTVEGVLTGHWTSRVRRAGTQRDYWSWEGFSVDNVDFAYIRNLEENYFHNGGPRSLDLQDGMRVRLRYIEDRDGNRLRNRILRMERGAEYGSGGIN